MQLISLLPLLAVLLLHTVAAQVRQSWEKVNIESQRYHLQDEYDEYEYDPNAIEGKVTLIMDVKTSSFLFRSARQCCRPPGQVIQILIKWKYLYFSHFYMTWCVLFRPYDDGFNCDQQDAGYGYYADTLNDCKVRSEWAQSCLTSSPWFMNIEPITSQSDAHVGSVWEG